MKRSKLQLQGDRVIWIVVIFLTLISLLAVYSSTQTMAFSHQASNAFYLLKHMGIILLGLFLMFLAHLLDYPKYSNLSKVLFPMAMLLLIVTFVWGHSVNEAKRWLTIPVINLTFQTSDVAKLALLMFLARGVTIKQNQLQAGDFRTTVFLFIPALIICGLILPSNFSTAAILFTSCIVVMYVAGSKVKHLFSIILGTIVLLTILLGAQSLLPGGKMGRSSVWEKRVESFMKKSDEDASYQATQSKIAIASGGIFGKMPGNSVQKNYIPYPYSDFIYAIIIEEYGLFGGFIIMLLYLALLFRSIKAGLDSPGTYGSLLAIGLGFNLVLQAMINMAVACGLFPVTGQPLPLVSMGGTSIWFTSLSIGIILSVSRSGGNYQAEGIKNQPLYES